MKANGGGSIINTSSTAGIDAGAGLISYRASKAAAIHVTRSIALDVAQYEIRVNCIVPGQIRTGMTTYDMDSVMKFTQPLPRKGQAEDLANAAVFLASDRSAQVTGIVLPVDGGTTAGPPAAQLKLCSPLRHADRAIRGADPPRTQRRSGGGEVELEAVEAAEEVGGQVLVAAGVGRAVGVLGDRDVGGAVEQAVDGDPALGPGQVGAGAVMDAVAEGDVVLGVGAVDVELVRVLEQARVPVGRPGQQQHRAAGGDVDAGDRRAPLGHAELGPQRALEPQGLLDEVGDAGRGPCAAASWMSGRSAMVRSAKDSRRTVVSWPPVNRLAASRATSFTVGVGRRGTSPSPSPS